MASRMNELSQYKKPVMYEKGSNMIWTDPYIAKQLLKAHLDPEFEGASRKKIFLEQSISWIEQVFPVTTFSKIIDFGCGPGLYAEPLTESGYRVTGIDFSKESIRYAKASADKKGLEINYIEADYLSWQAIEAYDLALLIYCDYGALNPKERKKILETMHRSLRKSGCILLDNFTQNEAGDFIPEKTWHYVTENDFWAKEKHLLLTRSERYSQEVILEQTILIKEEKEDIFNLWKYYSSEESLINECREAGFIIKAVYHDVAGGEFQEKSQTIAIVAEKV